MIEYRKFGEKGRTVFLVHGGPGAQGSLKGLGEKLGAKYRVFELFQGRSGTPPLTVEKHIRDMQEAILELADEDDFVVIGHSWGAMLTLCWAAECGKSDADIILVGCGTFDERSRGIFNEIIESRMTPELEDEFHKAEEIKDPDMRLCRMGNIMDTIYDFKNIPETVSSAECDALGHNQAWQSMMEMQHRCIYPQAFSAIKLPVTMIHGDYDPHPGTEIFENLREYIPQLKYIELSRCGHTPWKEVHAAAPFFDTVDRIIGRTGN